MKKVLYSIIATTFFAYMALTQGCELNPLLGTQVMKGKVYDVVTVLPVSNARISTSPGQGVVMSDSSGNFTLTGLSPGNYTITASKPGHFTVTFNQKIVAGDTAYTTVAMGVSFFRYNGLEAREFFNDNSLSAVNLSSGYVTQETDVSKDIQMRDSAGLSERFMFRSGSLAIYAPGFVTAFTEPLMNGRNFSKAEFDTLSKLYPVAGEIDPVRDFPNTGTKFYPTDLNGLHHVYGFYLQGRYNANPNNPKIYGMIYINSIIISGSEKWFKIDVKTNRNNENSFNLYP